MQNLLKLGDADSLHLAVPSQVAALVLLLFFIGWCCFLAAGRVLVGVALRLFGGDLADGLVLLQLQLG